MGPGSRDVGREWDVVRKHPRYVRDIVTDGIRLALYGPGHAGQWVSRGPMEPPLGSWGWVDPVMREASGGWMESEEVAIYCAGLRARRMAALDRQLQQISP